jgi:Rrf2 family nitric oxide-sensitive transcriptional repressor
MAGGVALAVDPATLQLGTLVRRLESKQPLVECFQGQGCACTLVEECRLKGMLRQAQQEFYAALDEHTLAECVPPGVEARGR